MKKKAVVLLHEIYGVNAFIKEMEEKIRGLGYEPVVVDLLEGQVYSYEEAKEAYDFYMKTVGFHRTLELNEFMKELKNQYESVCVVGFSAGAANAWKLSECGACDQVIACYGSRIRDYTQVRPKCPVLLVIANQDSYDVDLVCESLEEVPLVQIVRYDAAHGFLDAYGEHYDAKAAEDAWGKMKEFLVNMEK